MFIMRERTLGRTLSRTSCLLTGLSSRYSIHSNGTAHNTMIKSPATLNCHSAGAAIML